MRPAVAGRWAQEVAASGLFPALHVDVEPQALPQWTSDRDRAARGLLAALDAVRAAVRPGETDVLWVETPRTR